MPIKTFLIAFFSALPFCLNAQTTLFEDTFENRPEGSRLHDSISSDGRAVWVVQWGNGATQPFVTIHGDADDRFAASKIEAGNAALTRPRDRNNAPFRAADFRLEFDFLYLQSFADNRDLRVQYRLEDDFLDLDKGGVIPGYRVRLQAEKSKTRKNLIRWSIETDPDGSESEAIANGVFELGQLIVAGDDAPGQRVRVVLEAVGNRQRLELNGETVVNIKDARFGKPGEDAMNFKLIGGRNRGFDNLRFISAVQ